MAVMAGDGAITRELARWVKWELGLDELLLYVHARHWNHGDWTVDPGAPVIHTLAAAEQALTARLGQIQL